ncbi:MAG: hypothetical protein WA864_27235 [Acetobacteraceae bacterium]|jgi:hypothetical protein
MGEHMSVARRAPLTDACVSVKLWHRATRKSALPIVPLCYTTSCSHGFRIVPLAELRHYSVVLVDYCREVHREAAASREKAAHCRELADRAVESAARLRAGALAALQRQNSAER